MSDLRVKDTGQSAQLEAALRENSLYQDRIYFLTEMGNLLGQLDSSLLLVKILELTTEFVGADVGSILLVGPQGSLETTVNWGLPHEAAVDLRFLDGRPVLDHVLASGKPQSYRGSQLQPVLGGAYHVGTALFLPLRTERRVLGTILLVLPDADDPQRAERFDVLAPAVGLAAIAVENERLVHMKLANEREQQQLKLAQEIQRGLLPAGAPAVPGLDLGALYLPATEVGGDYYDYLPFSDGSLGLVIADVAGKGVSAGLVMTAVRSIFRTASHGTSQPARLLSQVNEQLCQERLSGYFVTAACIRVDVPRNELTLAVAGHEPVLLLRGSGIEVGGTTRRQPALGLVEKMVYQEDSCRFQPGDAFVLYTDGVTEAMNSFRNQFGMRRLQEVVAQCQGLGTPAVLQSITAALDEHVGTAPRHDDITLLVGRRVLA